MTAFGPRGDELIVYLAYMNLITINVIPLYYEKYPVDKVTVSIIDLHQEH